MKLRDIMLGSVLAAGMLGCAHKLERTSEQTEYLKNHPRSWGIGSVISSGPYQGFGGVCVDHGDNMVFTYTRTPQSSGGKSFASFEVSFSMDDPDGLVLKREGDFEYFPEAIRKMNPFFK